MSEFANLWQDTWVNINGEFVKGPEATVSVLDWSFVYGDGIFEGVRVAEGRMLKLDKHLDRFYRSAKRVRIGLADELTKAEMRELWLETARKNEMTDGYLRPIVTRGEGPIGISNNDRLEGPNVYVIPQLNRSGGLRELAAGRARLSAVRSPSPVVRDPRVKANHYIPNILAKIEIADTDASVPIRLDDAGYVTEAAGTNVFVVSGDTVLTPGEQRILSGTTRATLLEMLDAHDRLKGSVTDLTPYDLYTADECFVTGSITGVKSITHLNGDPIGTGEVGPVTEEINELLSNHLIGTGTPIE